MDFTNLPQIIITGLNWFFTPEMLSTPTFIFFKDLTLFIGGFLAFYFIAIFPFVISFKCIIRDWRMKK